MKTLKYAKPFLVSSAVHWSCFHYNTVLMSPYGNKSPVSLKKPPAISLQYK